MELIKKNSLQISLGKKGKMVMRKTISKTEQPFTGPCTETDDKKGRECTILGDKEISINTKSDLMDLDQNCTKLNTGLPNTPIEPDGQVSQGKQDDVDALTKFSGKWKLSYYWKTWRRFTLKTKTEKEKLRRLKKIDLFLARLMTTPVNRSHSEREIKGKKVVSHQNQKSGRRRKVFSVPKQWNTQAIATEKAVKLEEMAAEISKSSAEACENLRKSLKNFHPTLRPRVKALSMLSHAKGFENTETKRQRTYPVPEFLIRMDNRHRERKKRWEDIREWKDKIKAEQEKRKKERLQEQKKIEELEKRERLEKLKENAMKKKKMEEEKEREREMMKHMCQRAQEHYVRCLMRRVGLQPWRKLMEMKSTKLKKAVVHSEFRLTKHYMELWVQQTRLNVYLKCKKAEEVHNKNLVKGAFGRLNAEAKESLKKLQVAMDWADAKLEERAFDTWLQNIRKMRWNAIKKEEEADSVYERKILGNSFKQWRILPEVVKNEREKEKRKRIWQMKVRELIPDYLPSYVSEI